MTGGRYRRAASRLLKGGIARLSPARMERPLWVFGGASGRSYSDNASVVHAAATDRLPPESTVWVIDASSPDRDLAVRQGPIADRDSLRAHRLTQAAHAIFFSHGTQDVPGMQWNTEALTVRLGHGVTAFGRADDKDRRSLARMVAAVDLAPVASRMEQDHKMAWGFARHQLPVTGLPRWDAMLQARRTRTPGADERPLVLYVPTSRPWHTAADASPDGALAPMREFLDSPAVAEWTSRGEFDLAVHLHQNTRYRFGAFDWLPPQVRLLDAEADLPETIAQASLVISDYSSILWDALYLDTPVAFFQFDREAHLHHRGSFIDLHARLFGPTAIRADALLEILRDALDDGFAQGDWRADRERWQARAFAHRDDRNTERVLSAVEERLG